MTEFRIHPLYQILVKRTGSMDTGYLYQFMPLLLVGSAIGFWTNVPDHLKEHVKNCWP